MKMDEWLDAKKAYIRGIKSPSIQQKMLLLLAEKTHRSKDEERKFSVLVRAEKANDRAAKAKADAARIISAENKISRKIRNRELFQSAGLLILAGLVDSKSGKPVSDSAELLGGLLALSAVTDSEKRQNWKARGLAFLESQKSKKSDG